MIFKSAKVLLKTILIVSAIVFIAGYSYYQARHFIKGPVINVLKPANGTELHESIAEIQGEAENISFLSLNDREIYTDKEGQFKEKVFLYEGYNVITIKAVDKFDRETVKTLQIVHTNLPEGDKVSVDIREDSNF